MVDSAPPTRRVRLTQHERRQQTREALVFAALEAFARDGFHAANLEAIATAAGYSKGAIYSNFASKAELFLAVMDYNLGALRGGDWDPLTVARTGRGGVAGPSAAEQEEAAALVRGFALATLEFIAAAARDDALAEALRARLQVMVDGYRKVAESARSADETLPVDGVARLMTALDQGASVLTTLGGTLGVDAALLRRGMWRLVDPAGAAGSPPPTAEGTEPHPDIARVARLLAEEPGGA